MFERVKSKSVRLEHGGLLGADDDGLGCQASSLDLILEVKGSQRRFS